MPWIMKKQDIASNKPSPATQHVQSATGAWLLLQAPNYNKSRAAFDPADLEHSVPNTPITIIHWKGAHPSFAVPLRLWSDSEWFHCRQ